MLSTGLNYTQPLQSFITNFTYYNYSTLTPLIAENGVPVLNPRDYIYSFTNDYLLLNFSYSMVIPNLNSSMNEYIYNTFQKKGINPSFVVNYAFCGFNNDEFEGLNDYKTFDADPIIPTKNAASNSFHGYNIVIIVTSLLLIYYSLL